MCDLEMPEIYSHKIVFSRKQHKCSECKGKIMITEQYHVHSGKWDGDFLTFKICSCCTKLRQDIMKSLDSDQCFAFGDLLEDCQQSGGEFFKRFVTICSVRGAKIPQWMFDKIKSDNPVPPPTTSK